jgi:hypothetical protein
LNIAQLSTILGNLLLASITAWLAHWLWLEARRTMDRAVMCWLAGFCAVVLAAILGAVGRGIADRLDAAAAAVIWTFTMVAASAASCFFLIAILAVYTRGRSHHVLAVLALAKFALFAMWTAFETDYRLVIHDAAITILAITVLSSWGAWSARDSSAPWILTGTMASMLAAMFQQGRVSIHPNFDYNHLYYVMQSGAMYLLYRGGIVLRERSPRMTDVQSTQPLHLAEEE